MARGFWAGPAAIANRPGYLSPLPKSSGARIARQAAHSTAALPRTAPHDSRLAGRGLPGRGLPGVDCGRATGRAAHSPARKSGAAVHRAGSRGTALHDGKNNAFPGRPRRRPAPCAPCDPPGRPGASAYASGASCGAQSSFPRRCSLARSHRMSTETSAGSRLKCARPVRANAAAHGSASAWPRCAGPVWTRNPRSVAAGAPPASARLRPAPAGGGYTPRT